MLRERKPACHLEVGQRQDPGKVEICPVRTTGRVGPGLRWQQLACGVARARLDTIRTFRYLAGALVRQP
jgi:hypothetical protein